MKPWIIAALICSAYAAYAAEDDNKIHPTCVEENNTRRCWVDHGPPTGVRPRNCSPWYRHRRRRSRRGPAMVPFPPPPRWWPPPLIFRFGPYGLTVPRRYPARRPAEHRLTEPRPIAYSWMALTGGAKLHLGVNTKNRSHG